MKFLSRLRYFLFALFILGWFAAFAQNDYGLSIISCSELFIGITFLLGLFVGFKNAENKIWFLLVNILGSFSFISFYLISSIAKHADTFLNITTISLFSFFIVLGILTFLENKKEHWHLRFFLLLFFLFVIFAVYGVGFATNLIPPFQNIAVHFANGIVILLFFIYLFGKKIESTDKKNIFTAKLKLMPDFVIVVSVFFLWWCAYLELRERNILPEAYSSITPPALQKLMDEGKKEQAETFEKNYLQFLENRKKENN